jgi:hypothetical protein
MEDSTASTMLSVVPFEAIMFFEGAAGRSARTYYMLLTLPLHSFPLSLSLVYSRGAIPVAALACRALFSVVLCTTELELARGSQRSRSTAVFKDAWAQK